MKRNKKPPSHGGRTSSRTVSGVVLRSELDRQLDGHDIVVFWRAATMPGRREGLALKIHTCDAKDCQCRTVTLDGIVVADDAAQVDTRAGSLRVHRWSTAPQSQRGILVKLDIDTGVLSAGDEPCDPDLFAWVCAEIDGELLERLHECWLIGKGVPGRGPIRATLDPRRRVGELLDFDEVYMSGRFDRFVISKTSYGARTYLCPDPKCDCHRAAVVFGVTNAERSDEIGRVELVVTSAPDVTLVETRTESGRDKLLGQLWELFTRRHDVCAYLAGREARMRMAWPAIERARLLTNERSEARVSIVDSSEGFARTSDLVG